MNMNFNYKKQENNTPIMDKATSNLQSIFEKCVKYDSSNRITTKKILKMIIKEAISLIYKVDSNIFNDTNETLLFILEMVIILKNNWKEAQKIQKYIQRLLSLILTKIKKQLEKVFNKIYCAFFLFNYIYHTKDFNLLHDIKNAIHQITLFADQNNPEAQLLLGKIYYEGKYVSRDINKSIHYLTLSANQGNTYAQQKLGDIYYEGKCIGRDINKSIHYLTLSANQNNSDAQFILGEIYYEGKYISHDINKSIYYLTLSANQNNSCAQFVLGIIYYENKYLSRDIIKSIHYLTQSAKQNHSKAQFFLSNIYMEDKSVQNINESIKYLQYSASNNYREAQLILADLLFEGIHLKYEIEKIIHLYKEASCFNDQYAKNNLGVIYKNGISGINKNLSLAKEYFKEAVAQKNDAVSMFNLSNLLLNEEQETKDYKKVIELLIGSSHQGLEESLQLLAFILIEKLKSICYDTIINELNAYGQQSNNLVIRLFQMCKIFLHENEESFQKMYQNIRKTNLIYIKHKIYTLNEVEKARYSHVLSQKSNLKDIDEYFYEGFEFPI